AQRLRVDLAVHRPRRRTSERRMNPLEERTPTPNTPSSSRERPALALASSAQLTPCYWLATSFFRAAISLSTSAGITVFSICRLIRLSGRTILADHDQRREEDRLQGDNHGEKVEWIWVEWIQSVDPAAVDRYPRHEPQNMNIEEHHAAREIRDPIGNAILQA